MTFWKAYKEAFLEWLFGAHQLQAWRDEEKQRVECERILQANYDKYLRSIS